MEAILVFVLALGIDLTCGEPSNRWHPVAWIGLLIDRIMALAPEQGKKGQFVFGAGAVITVAAVFAVLSYLLVAWLQRENTVAFIMVTAVLLKFCFSLKGLKQAANRVEKLLRSDNLPEASSDLKALVSRDTHQLSREQMISAILESVAENSCDSFIAPLFYFLIFGLPGAVAYRIINTFDAMIGYHGKWEYLGKFAARLDDVANYVPARISALLIVLSALLCGKDVRQAWRIMVRDHSKTESPNAGWTMSALAGALGIRLEKPGYYVLGDGQNALSLKDIDMSVSMLFILALIWSLLSFVGLMVYHAAT